MLFYLLSNADSFDHRSSNTLNEITIIDRSISLSFGGIRENAQNGSKNVNAVVQSVKFPQDISERQREYFLRSVPAINLFDVHHKNGYLQCDGPTCIGRLVFRRDVSRQEIDDFAMKMQSLEYLSPNDHEVYWVLDRKFDFNTDSKDEYVTIKFEKR